MSKTTLLIGLAVALLAVSPAMGFLSPDNGDGVKVGSSLKWLADHKVMTTTGKEFSFRQLLPTTEGNETKEGTVFVLSFWSQKCPWSVAWDTELSAIAKDYASKGVKVFGINSNKKEIASKESVQAVNGYMEEKAIPFPVLVDKHNKIADLFGAKTTPHIFVCDSKGTVIYTGAIDDDAYQQKEAAERKTYLRDALNAQLAGEAIAVPETSPKGCGIKRLSKEEMMKLSPAKVQS